MAADDSASLSVTLSSQERELLIVHGSIFLQYFDHVVSLLFSPAFPFHTLLKIESYDFQNSRDLFSSFPLPSWSVKIGLLFLTIPKGALSHASSMNWLARFFEMKDSSLPGELSYIPASLNSPSPWRTAQMSAH